MSQAEDLLNSLFEEDTSAYAMEDEPHIVINSDRTITVPDELKHIAVQFDHNIETVTFDCPRYWDELDFSKMHAYINYMRPDGYMDQYPVKNLRVDDSDDSIIHFEWVISKNVTQNKGNISFLVCIKTIDDEGEEEPHWNSRLNRDFIIDEGMECDEQIAENNPDVIEEVLTRIEKIETTGGVTDEQVETAVNAYLSENPILTLPQFDLSELGLPVIVPDTGAQTLETDTTDIMSALDKGLVKVSFIIRLDVDTQCASIISPVYLAAKSTYHGFIKWYYNKEYYTVMFNIANGSLSVTAVTDADCSFWVEQAVV